MKRNTINDNLIKTTYIFIILFGLLISYLLIFVIFESGNIIDNSYNKRIDTLSNYVDKGNIYSKDLEVLATTDEDGNRYYPYASLFCHVVGSTAMGNTGLENAYNYEMLSSNVNIFKKFINELSGEKHPGNSIVTTLDVNISQNCKNALGGYKGAVIVMDPTDGSVLSMVSNPDYDPNTVARDWDTLSSSTNGELLNRATSGQYTPGSIFKIFTLYDYITENPDTYKNYNFTCKGTVDFGDYTISCSNKIWHGNEDLLISFANSCNCSFVNLSEGITTESLSNICKKLLFNSDLPIEIEYKSSVFSLTADDSSFMKHQTLIGQGKTLVSPIHMILVMNAIANDGVLITPRFVSKLIDYSGTILEEYEIKNHAILFTKEETDILKEYLRQVVLTGTASSINNSNYTLYGKTGTAQIDENGNINSWFVGFVEKNDKIYTICVVIENVNENASPAKNIASNIVNTLP
ncbi:MAG: penicillin-binding protein 2 [Lachnospiraceae bacterium]|nr:penicillin-binding protein 2 [Lachnospiraceae bacterium]